MEIMPCAFNELCMLQIMKHKQIFLEIEGCQPEEPVTITYQHMGKTQ